MLTVTDNAKQHLKKLLLAADESDASLRLRATGGKLGLVLDSEAEGDQIVEYEGSKVLLVGQELSSAVDGVTLDIEDTPDGPQLTLHKE